MTGDFAQDPSTLNMSAANTASGEFTLSLDRDWFAIERIAGQTHLIYTDGTNSTRRRGCL